MSTVFRPSTTLNVTGRKYPYFLPTAVAGMIPLCFVPFAFWKMKETSVNHRKDYPASMQAQDTQSIPSSRLLSPHVLFFLLLWLSIITMNGINTQLAIFLFYSAPQEGGLNLMPRQIGTIFMIRAIMIPFFEIPLFGPLHNASDQIGCFTALSGLPQ